MRDRTGSRDVVQHRSRERRRLLLDCAVELVVAEGLRKLTHREVARRANVPPATTGYYFATTDALIEETLLHYMAHCRVLLGDLLESAVETSTTESELLTRIATGLVDGETAVSIAQYEVFIEATRRPVLQKAVAQTAEGFAETAGPLLRDLGIAEPRSAALAVVAAVDGLSVHRFSHPQSREAEIEMTRQTLMGIFAAYVIGEQRLIEVYREGPPAT